MKNFLKPLLFYFKGWNRITKTPPNEKVQIIDASQNTAFAFPSYFPFEIKKLPGDEKKTWGWRGTPVFYEDGVERWDGNWMVLCEDMTIKIDSKIIGWKKIKKQTLDGDNKF